MPIESEVQRGSKVQLDLSDSHALIMCITIYLLKLIFLVVQHGV